MKILYLCTYYHTALLYRQMIDALSKRGFEFRVFNSTFKGEGVGEKFKPIIDDIVVHTECWNKKDRTFFFPRQWKIEKALQNAYDLKEFDLLHSHLFLSSGYTARKMKKKYGLPYVVSVRATDMIGFIKLPFFRNMAKKNMKEANGILFLSPMHKKEFKEKYVDSEDYDMFEKKTAVIGNPLEKFWEVNTAEPRKNVPDHDQLNILLVGRITPFKNIPTAVKAIEILHERNINVTFNIIGEVESEEEYNKIPKHEYVNFIPFMKKEELIHEYRKNDIFFLPSTVETFGRVYVEAMSQGLPVVYSRGQGFDERYPEGTVGYSCDVNDPKEMADRIEEILKNYTEISANCIEKCKDYYEDEIVSKMEQFYNNAMKGN